MNLRLKRRLAIAVLALLAFAQASMALAACAMDRGSMGQAMTMPSDEPCDCGAAEVQQPVSATCVAHCTADLQAAGLPVALVRQAASTPVLVVALVERSRVADLRSP